MQSDRCFCHKCGTEIHRDFKFCNKCGEENPLYESAEEYYYDESELSRTPSYKERWESFKGGVSEKYKDFRQNMNERISNAREGIANRIEKTLNQMEEDEGSLPGYRALSSGGKSRVIEALENAKKKLQTSEIEMEESDIKALEVYIETLPERLQEENCIVCMKSFKDSTETIVVCPHCERGGHKSHMVFWLEGSNIGIIANLP